MPAWLPGLMLMSAYPTWDAYLDAIYAAFRADFITSRPQFRGSALGLKSMPMTNGKEATFWHFIQSGESGQAEEDRIPDIRRCERICWPRAVIENCDQGADVKVWWNERHGKRRTLLWVEQESYLIVLAHRSKNYVLPWTAYLVERDHYRRKLQQEWEGCPDRTP